MLTEKVKKTILNNNLIKQGDRILTALSGGADSVCLLICLNEIKDEIGFVLEAAHINHMIRGDEAEADAKFAEELCKKLNIKFHLAKINVPEIAKDSKKSLEEAARDARYEALRDISKGSKIAVAHNSNDQEETILFNIIRGSGLTGLTGMKYSQDDIIRPLLDISRKEIEEFLSFKNQDYRTDSTNKCDNYTRNKIRLNILPYIKQNINEKTGEHLRGLAASASLAEDLIEELAKDFKEKNVKNGRALTEKIISLHPAVKSRVLYDMVCDAAGRKKDIEYTHIDLVSELLLKPTGSKINLPYDVTAKISYEYLCVEKESNKDFDIKKAEAEKQIDALNKALKLSLDKPLKKREDLPVKIEENLFNKFFDYDKIKGKLFWRFPESGDVISLAGAKEKPLNRFMIDNKIPRDERMFLPVLSDGKNIIWIFGYRINEDYKIKEDTKNIIEITAVNQLFQ